MLTDFTIKNFRGIKELTLPSLKRVNLFVGKNGVGKTSVLEAVELWAADFSPQAMLASLQRRGEAGLTFTRTPVDALFGGEFKLQPVTRDSSKINMAKAKTLGAGPEGGFELVQVAEDQILSGPRGSIRLYDHGWPPVQAIKKTVFVSSSGVDETQLDQLWTAQVLEKVEQRVTTALRLCFPEVEDVSFGDVGRRLALVGLANESRRVPLVRLGDGAMRILGLTLSLAAAKDGILLIDEFENGLHYSIQRKIWAFMLELSKEERLNVQVFATTHSRDTLSSLAEASNADDHIAYRLDQEGGKIRAVSFAPDELDVAADYAVEIR